jgi:hypothetical protein
LTAVNLLTGRYPVANGWECRLADIPGSRADSSVIARVVYCGVKE